MLLCVRNRVWYIELCQGTKQSSTGPLITQVNTLYDFDTPCHQRSSWGFFAVMNVSLECNELLGCPHLSSSLWLLHYYSCPPQAIVDIWWLSWRGDLWGQRCHVLIIAVKNFLALLLVPGVCRLPSPSCLPQPLFLLQKTFPRKM